MSIKARLIKIFTIIVFSFIPQISWASPAILEEIPSKWLLQDYLGQVATWFTSSSCSNGLLMMPASASADANNRFWSTVLSAKLSGKIMGVHYDNATCFISDFYLKGD